MALFCLEKQCSGLFRYFFVAFSWLFRFGQILRVLALEQSSDKYNSRIKRWGGVAKGGVSNSCQEGVAYTPLPPTSALCSKWGGGT